MRPADWAVELWNRLMPMGAAVELTNDLGGVEVTTTRSKAWVLCNDPVVMVAGRSGGYSLWRIQPQTLGGRPYVPPPVEPGDGPDDIAELREALKAGAKERPVRGWTCAVCGLEVHHDMTACPDCKTERGCG
jgi:hypothetical protein